jgi:hypothetical protein
MWRAVTGEWHGRAWGQCVHLTYPRADRPRTSTDEQTGDRRRAHSAPELTRAPGGGLTRGRSKETSWSPTVRNAGVFLLGDSHADSRAESHASRHRGLVLSQRHNVPGPPQRPVHNLGTADNHMAARKAELLAEIRCHRCVAIAQQYVRLHSRHSVRHKYDRVLQLDCPDRPAGPGSPILPDPPPPSLRTPAQTRA